MQYARTSFVLNCGNLTEKVSDFLDHHLQPLKRKDRSYILDTRDFITELNTNTNDSYCRYPSDSICGGIIS